MKKRFSMFLLTACLAVSLTGCGTKEDVKVISKDIPTKEAASGAGKDSESKETVANANDNTKENSSETSQEENSSQKETEKLTNTSEETNTSVPANLKGYIFQTQGISGMISMGVDMDAASVIEGLGKPDSYFEAPSCAFQGIDKMYTYSHFEIDTYPDGDKDKISMILFLDDLVSTSEGICIGMSKEDMEKAYGTDYEVSNGFYRYTKDNMKLSFIIKNGEITSIEYDSLVLNQGQ